MTQKKNIQRGALILIDIGVVEQWLKV